MGRQKGLSSEERAQISVLKNLGHSNRFIAKKINRSVSVVCNFVNKGDSYGVKKPRGVHKKLSGRDYRRIIREAVKPGMSSSKIKTRLQLQVTDRRIRQILNESGQVKWAIKSKKPMLSTKHKEARLKFAKDHMSWTNEWKRVIFSDEKKFNLDGPDGLRSYWHVVGREKEVSYSRNFGGGTVMVWGGFSCYGTTPICWITTKMTSAKYIELLDDVLVTYLDEHGSQDLIFQQDNAPIQASRKTKAYFEENNIAILPWPARSPDLNPIENVWGYMAHKVYESGHFETVRELKATINDVWTNLAPSYLQNLIDSMPKRIFEVIKNKGGNTHY